MALESVTRGKASVWKASQIAGVSIIEFLKVLEERKIDWVKIPSAELEEELKCIEGAG